MAMLENIVVNWICIMSVNMSVQEIMDVFLESDTDEEDCLIDETVTEKENKFKKKL